MIEETTRYAMSFQFIKENIYRDGIECFREIYETTKYLFVAVFSNHVINDNMFPAKKPNCFLDNILVNFILYKNSILFYFDLHFLLPCHPQAGKAY